MFESLTVAPKATFVPDNLAGSMISARESLFFLGRVVFGVLAEIAVVAGHSDLSADLVALDLLEVLELFPEPAISLRGHRDFAFHAPVLPQIRRVRPA